MSSIIAQMLSSFHFTKHLSPSISLVLYQKKKKSSIVAGASHTLEDYEQRNKD
jgi:hypothetical protein